MACIVRSIPPIHSVSDHQQTLTNWVLGMIHLSFPVQVAVPETNRWTSVPACQSWRTLNQITMWLRSGSTGMDIFPPRHDPLKNSLVFWGAGLGTIVLHTVKYILHISVEHQETLFFLRLLSASLQWCSQGDISCGKLPRSSPMQM